MRGAQIFFSEKLSLFYDMHYTVTTQDNNHFSITDERQDMLGSLEYTLWLPKKAVIQLTDNTVYDLVPTGFWMNITNVTKNGEAYAVIKYNWVSSSLEITFANNTQLIFRRKNILEGTYVATDAADNEIALVQTAMNWKSLGFNYEIDVQDDCADEETTTLLPFLLAYCTRHLRRSHYAGMGTI